MRNTVTFTAWLLAVVLAFAAPVYAQDDSTTARKQIEETFGTVPSYFQVYPNSALGAGWALMRGVNFNQNMALDPKMRELISLSVAAQIPCEYGVYYHRKAARSLGATEEELKEAVLIAGIVRHWSTILQGNGYDMEAFRTETDGFFPDNKD